jgi:osmoprotectant transport system permease protein
MNLLSWLLDPANWSGPGGVPVRVAEHLYYTLLAVLCAAVIAVPLGLLIGHSGRGGVGLVGMANAMRALPTLGLVTFLFLLLADSVTATVIALVILAIPPVLAGAYAGVQSVDRGVVDAAIGMGMTPAQRLMQVELPGALPLLIGGVRSAVLQVIATTSVAAYVGLGGLGRPLLDGLQQGPGGYPEMFAGAVLTALLALLVDLSLAGAQRAVVPRGVRLATAAAAPTGRAAPQKGVSQESVSQESV